MNPDPNFSPEHSMSQGESQIEDDNILLNEHDDKVPNHISDEIDKYEQELNLPYVQKSSIFKKKIENEEFLKSIPEKTETIKPVYEKKIISNSVEKQRRPTEFHQIIRMQEGENELEEIEDLALLHETTIKKKKTIKDVFEPNETIPSVWTETDLKIIETDQPERFQLKGIKIGTNAELTDETNWICEMMKLNRGISISEGFHKKILKALTLMRNSQFEIPYLLMYKKNELYPEVQGNDLWEIYDLDEEWRSMQKLRESIEKTLKNLENFMQIPSLITEALVSASTIQNLSYIQDFANFNLSKYIDPASQPSAPKRVFAYDVIQLRLDQFASLACISSSELAENLLLFPKPPIYLPKYEDITPEKVAEKYVNPEKTLVSDTLTVLTNVCRFIANELFHNAIIRNFIKKAFYENVTISTEPTLQGKKELDATHPFYPTKRIFRRPINEFEDDLWIKMLKSERDGLIKIRLMLPWDDDLKDNGKEFQELQDSIYNSLLKAYIAPFHADTSEEMKKIIIQWNILRGEVLRILFVELVYPYLDRNLREELREKAEKYVLKICGDKLRDLLLTAPLLMTEEDSSDPPHKPRIVSVLVDPQSQTGKISFVSVDPRGELKNHLTLKFFASGGDTTQSSLKDAYEKDCEEFDKFMQQSSPEVVLVAANCLEARRIYRLMKDYSETLDRSRRPVVVFGDPTVAQLFVKTSQADQEFKALPNIIKEGISLARYMQNPMAEILGLWSDKNQDNAVFYIPFHPLQNQLTLNRLKKEYEKVAMEVSNSIGISINELNYRHLSTGLQFLCGMGSRKASQLLEDLKNPSIEKIRNRSDLFNFKLMGKKVYTNIAGFIRIKAERDFDALDFEETSGKLEPLDGTRIHPETYLLAKKIAKDAVDEDCPINEWIPRVIKAPYKLRDLDLEDYAQHLAAYKNKPNMLHILSFIVEELTFPFRDPRNRSWELNEKEVFFKLTKENPESFKPKGFTNVKIQKILKSNLLCKLDCGIMGSIFYLDVFDSREITSDSLGQFFSEGQTHKARIKSIDFEKYRTELTIRPSDLKVTRSQLREMFEGWNLLEKFFRIREEEDFPQISEAKQQKQLKFAPQRLAHDKYMNVSMAVACEQLNDRQIGDYIIRPSARSPDNLAITWKFYNNINVHLEINKSNTQYGTKYQLGKDVFETIDDLLEKYIHRCNNIMVPILSHKKFKKGSESELENLLLEEKSKDANTIPFCLGCFEATPQFVAIFYFFGKEIVKEYVKIKPEGLFFHNAYFTSINMLIVWFKQNFKTQEYQAYLDRSKPLFCDLDNIPLNSQFRPITENNPIILPENDDMIESQYSQGHQSPARSQISRRSDFARPPPRDFNRGQGPPECTFCQKKGHTEDRCFQKNGGKKEGGGPTWKKYTNNNIRNNDGHSNNTDNSWGAGNSEANQQSSTQETGWGGNATNTNENQQAAPTWGGEESKTSSQNNNEASWGGNESNQIPEKKQQQSGNNGWGEENKNGDSGGGGWGNEVNQPQPEKSSGAGWGNEPAQSHQENSSKTGWGDCNNSATKSANNGWGDSSGGGGNWGGNSGTSFGSKRPFNGGSDDPNPGKRRFTEGGSRPKGCFNCNKEGHMSKDCPEPQKPKNACFKCDQTGHFAKDCTNPNLKLTCGYCKENGHKTADCTKKNKKCFKCNQEGHSAKDCTTPEDQIKDFCKYCKQEGHKIDACPTKKPRICFNCQQEGHNANDCTNEKVPRPRDPNFSGGKKGGPCFNCGEEGHNSRDCTKEKIIKCNYCKEEGHDKMNCEKKKKKDQRDADGGGGNGGGDNSCYICKSKDHKSFECPNKKSGDKRTGGNNACFICKKEDHKSFDCPEKKNRGGGNFPPRNDNRSRSRDNDKFQNSGNTGGWAGNSGSGDGWGSDKKNIKGDSWNEINSSSWDTNNNKESTNNDNDENGWGDKTQSKPQDDNTGGGWGNEKNDKPLENNNDSGW